MTSRFVKNAKRGVRVDDVIKGDITLTVKLRWPSVPTIRIDPLYPAEGSSYEIHLDQRDAWSLFMSLANTLGEQGKQAMQILAANERSQLAEIERIKKGEKL